MNLKSFITGSVFTGMTLLGAIGHAGWSSGGGELVRDANNPWFLSNTKDVKYCIQIDEKNFGQTKQQVRERIGKALQFWQIQLKDLVYLEFGHNTNFDPRVGTQNFKEELCSDKTDIVFQFGILTAEQKEKLKDLSKTIGITVRTDYDEVNMKGKGFVYIAPEAGTLKPTVDGKIEKMWSNFDGTLLFPVLIHEVGHIFGLKHDDIDFMREDFVQSVFEVFDYPDTIPRWWTDFEKNNWQREKIFKHDPFAPVRQLFCLTSSISSKKTRKVRSVMSFDKFFNISEQYECANSYIEEGKFVISARRKDEPHSPSVKLGEMNLQATNKIFADKNVIGVWFSEKQKVIQDAGFVNAYPLARMYSEVFYKGNYISADGKTTRRIVVTATPAGIKNISGTLNGEIYQSIYEGF